MRKYLLFLFLLLSAIDLLANPTTGTQYINDTLIRHNDTLIVPVEYGTTPNLSAYSNTAFDCDFIYTFVAWTPSPSVQGTDPVTYRAIYDTTFRTPMLYDEADTIIQGNTYNWRGRALTVAGVYYDSLQTAAGCDSVYRLTLTVIDSSYNVTVVLMDTVAHTTCRYGQVPDLSAFMRNVVRCDSTFCFVHWTPSPTPQDTVTMTYTAIYASTATMYNVKWYNWDGSVIDSTNYVYGAPVNLPANPTCPADSSYIYSFYGWTPEPEATMACGNRQYTAVFLVSPRYYYDTLIRHNDTLKVPVEYGTTPDFLQYQDTTEDCYMIYHFHHWTPSVAPQDTAARKYIAVYSTTFRTPMLYDEADTIIQGNTYNWHGRALTVAGVYYDSLQTAAGCDSVYRLTLTVIDSGYNVTVVLMDTVAHTTCRYGQVPDLSAFMRNVVRCDSTFCFVHWIPSPTPQDTVTMTYTAVYASTATMYNVKWYNWDGSVIDSTNYVYGAPVNLPANPTCPADSSYIYSFYGWTPEPEATMACGNRQYTAVFLVSPRYYYDTLIRRNDTLIVPVEYGTTPDFSQYQDTTEDCYIIYQFHHWTPSVAPQDTAAGKYIAVYSTTMKPQSLYEDSATICHGDTVYWHGVPITMAGVYYDSLRTTEGCDSICKLTLTYAQYTVSATANDTAMGYVTGAGTYECGTIVTMTATANANYRFVGWDNGETGSTFYLTLESDTSLVAIFAAEEPTSVGDVEGVEYIVYTEQSQIVVAGADEVFIYDATGKIIFQGKTEAETARFEVPVAGVYFVRCDNRTNFRIVVK